jgi:hypothetical protein
MDQVHVRVVDVNTLDLQEAEPTQVNQYKQHLGVHIECVQQGCIDV